MNENKADVNSDDPARIKDFAKSTTLMLTNLKDHIRNVTIGTNANFNQMESSLDSDDDTEAEDDMPFETKLKLATDEQERRSFVNEINESNSNFLNEENSEAS